MDKKDIKIVIGASIISTFLGAVGGAAISEYRHNNHYGDSDLLPLQTESDFTAPEHIPM